MIPETSQTLKISRCIYTSGVMSTIKPDESQQSWLTKKKKKHYYVSTGKCCAVI